MATGGLRKEGKMKEELLRRIGEAREKLEAVLEEYELEDELEDELEEALFLIHEAELILLGKLTPLRVRKS